MKCSEPAPTDASGQAMHQMTDETPMLAVPPAWEVSHEEAIPPSSNPTTKTAFPSGGSQGTGRANISLLSARTVADGRLR